MARQTDMAHVEEYIGEHTLEETMRFAVALMNLEKMRSETPTEETDRTCPTQKPATK